MGSFRRHLLAAIMAFVLTVITACSGSSGGGNASNGPNATSQEGSEEAAQAKGPFGKYDKPITVTTVKRLENNTKFKEGESIENNIWTRTFESELGIKLSFDWIVETAQFEQKMNVSISSGSLPDIFPVTASQLQQLVEGNKLADLTKVFDEYASDMTKTLVNQDGGIGMKSATFKGKLMAIPAPGPLTDQSHLVWVRTDWLTKLNLPEPKTLADLLKISEAFTKNDPDGNRKDDTVGLIADNTVFDTLRGFFNINHAYPGIWMKDQSGQLVSGIIQPEVKTALAQLQKMYKDGQLDREFGVKDLTKTFETIASGKAGIVIGSMAYPLAVLQRTKENDPNAEWKPFPLPSSDDKPVRIELNPTVGLFYAANENTKHPEALIKLLNMFIEKMWGATADPGTFHKSEGVEMFKYPPVIISKVKKNLEGYRALKHAFETKDISKLDVEQKTNYDSIVKFKDGDASQWGYNMVFGEGGSQSVIDSYDQNGMFIYNEFIGAATPTMVQKGATLNKLVLETFTKIIMGDEPVDQFDTFVEQWKKLGGDSITREVNESMASR